MQKSLIPTSAVTDYCGNSRESWRSPVDSAIVPGEGFSEHAYDYLSDKSDIRSGHHIVVLSISILQSKRPCVYYHRTNYFTSRFLNDLITLFVCSVSNL